MKRKAILTLGLLTFGLAPLTASAQQASSTDPAVQQQLAEALAADKARDDATALRLWLPLAKAGVAEAQYHIGIMLRYGPYLCKDKSKAEAWFLKAADQDDTDAERELGKLYYFDETLPDHMATAEAWFMKAALKGDVESQYWIGNINSTGEKPTREQLLKAAYWFEKAAAGGNIDAAEELGGLYAFGRGVAKNPVKAAYWFRKAAEADDAEAQFELGRLYEKGEGVPKDYVQAYKWYALAASSGHLWGEEVATATNKVASEMTAAQIAKAKALVTAFRKIYPSEGQPGVIMAPPVPGSYSCHPFLGA